MKIFVLSNNIAKEEFLSEHGLSFYIEHQETNILFDTGASDVFLKNSVKLGIDLFQSTDYVVLSHGHWDHGNGLKFIENQTLITHPNSFIKRFRKGDSENTGLDQSKEKLSEKFNIIESDKTYNISPSIIYLGSIPRLNDFESKNTTFVDEFNNEDFVEDDSAIAIKDKDELIIITGCSHSGICNIIEYAKEVSGLKKVKAVIGGFHLKHNNKQVEKTIEYFASNSVDTLYPCHCTSQAIIDELSKYFNVKDIKSGFIILNYPK